MTCTRTSGSSNNRTLTTYIENCIHHPENTTNPRFTEDQLGECTTELVRIVEKLNAEMSTEVVLPVTGESG